MYCKKFVVHNYNEFSYKTQTIFMTGKKGSPIGMAPSSLSLVSLVQTTYADNIDLSVLHQIDFVKSILIPWEMIK